MMGYYGQFMGGCGGTFGVLGLLTWLVWVGVGVLLFIWLWQKISHK